MTAAEILGAAKRAGLMVSFRGDSMDVRGSEAAKKVHVPRLSAAAKAIRKLVAVDSASPVTVAAEPASDARGAALDAGPWSAIYLLTKEWTMYSVLCDPCVAARIAAKWTVKEVGERPGSMAPQRCVDCRAREQARAANIPGRRNRA